MDHTQCYIDMVELLTDRTESKHMVRKQLHLTGSCYVQEVNGVKEAILPYDVLQRMEMECNE